MKIIAGKYHGRKFLPPESGTHPMGSRVRMALFNILALEIPEAEILDAFAGSGSLGLEALSRGAKSVVFVDNSALAYRTLKQNLVALRDPEVDAKVLKMDITKYPADLQYDIVFADPPYNEFDPAIIQGLVKNVKPGGVLALSHPGESPEFDGVTFEKNRQYAGAHLTFYRKD